MVSIFEEGDKEGYTIRAALVSKTRRFRAIEDLITSSTHTLSITTFVDKSAGKRPVKVVAE